MSSIHLRSALCLPLSSHAAATAPSPRNSSASRPFLRGLTMQGRSRTAPRLRLVSHCAADQKSQPSPEEDPGVAELQMTLFRDEDDKLRAYMREIASNRCILYKEGWRLALMLCSRVGTAIQLSAVIAANARLRVDESSRISFLMVEQIVRTYVLTFLKIVDDTCHRKVDRTSIISFLDALRGLAAISHILIQDALDVLNNIEDCSKTFSTVFDVEALNNELHYNMKELEMKFTTASDREAYKLLWSTLTSATDHVSLFVFQMIPLRKKIVKHVQNHVGRGHTIGKEHTNDIEHDNDKEHTNDGT